MNGWTASAVYMRFDRKNDHNNIIKYIGRRRVRRGFELYESPSQNIIYSGNIIPTITHTHTHTHLTLGIWYLYKIIL